MGRRQRLRKLRKLVKEGTIMEERCEVCKFFYMDRKLSEIDGECRKKPPTVFLIMMQKTAISGAEPTAISYFPPIKKTHWCGDFKVKLLT